MIARIQQSMKEKDKGFTLIELLVVIIIIGILAAIAIPVFLNQREKAVDTGIKSDLRSIANELESYYVDNQSYPTAIDTSTAGEVTIAAGASSVADVTLSLSDDNTEINYTDNTNSFLVTGENGDNGTGAVFTYNSAAGGLQD